MNVRFKNGSELPSGWYPGQPVPGQTVNLSAAQECPFGAECYSCRIGLHWHPGFETHLKPPVADR